MINRLNRQISLSGARSDDIGSRLPLADIIHKAIYKSSYKLFPTFSTMHHLSVVYPFSRFGYGLLETIEKMKI